MILKNQLPVGVVIPVWNCRNAIPRHLEHICKWLDCVEEVVVVDSHSTDGTMDYIRKNLQHPNLRLLDHPPGLYQSWNHGISHIRSKYLQIATVGDGLQPESLDLLVETAEKLQAGVVVSPPKFIGKNVSPDCAWPIHEMVRVLEIDQPQEIRKNELFGWALANLPATLIGSSASNLYLTQYLQENPFPYEYGHAGDSAWAIQHTFNIKWAIEPRAKSKFWIHPPRYNIQRSYAEIAAKLSSLPYQVFSQADQIYQQDPFLLRIVEKYRQIGQMEKQRLIGRGEYECIKEKGAPWNLLPSRWKKRSQLRELKSRLKVIRGELRSLVSS